MDKDIFDPVKANAENRNAHFMDDVSRCIYDSRVQYAMTGDERFLKQMIRDSVPLFSRGGYLQKRIFSAEEIWLFGTGDYGRMIANLWPMKLAGFLDNAKAKQGTVLMGKPVIAPEDIGEHPDATVVITSRPYHKEMKEQLLSLSVKESSIIDVGGWVEDVVYTSIYFDLPELPHVEDEVFVDVGSYDGESACFFADWAKGEYQQIFCLEPDPANQQKIRERMAGRPNVTIVPKGAWDEATELRFVADGRKQSHVGDEGDTIVPVDTIDHILGDVRPTFIKMDIEGSELRALKGAEQAIRKYRPKLAISIYHRPEDIFTLPDLLLTYHSDYRFYLRHYSLGYFDTVLYAI